nr:aldose epimerase family protein [uncultured Cohaesibacter sp.]
MSREIFGAMPDGRPVERVRLSGGGLTASVLTFGAVVQDLRLNGHDKPLVLGFEAFEPYLTKSPYFGAMAGRYANRICDGRFVLDGVTHQVDQNFLGKHCLHGGVDGISQRLWNIEALDADAVTLVCTLEDGHMGYPGAMDIRLRYALQEGGCLDIQIEASADKATLCNLAHHSYFNLDGSPTIDDHVLQVSAEHYLPVDDEAIPTGEIAPVEGTWMDFRNAKRLGDALAEHSIDHNFCLSEARQSLRPIACLQSPASRVKMTVLSTEPGVQAYDGSYIDAGMIGLDGCEMGPRAGFCLEPQVWPDAPNHPDFPQAVLRPGETYRQQTQYVFSKG